MWFLWKPQSHMWRAYAISMCVREKQTQALTSLKIANFERFSAISQELLNAQAPDKYQHVWYNQGEAMVLKHEKKSSMKHLRWLLMGLATYNLCYEVIAYICGVKTVLHWQHSSNSHCQLYVISRFITTWCQMSFDTPLLNFTWALYPNYAHVQTMDTRRFCPIFRTDLGTTLSWIVERCGLYWIVKNLPNSLFCFAT